MSIKLRDDDLLVLRFLGEGATISREFNGRTWDFPVLDSGGNLIEGAKYPGTSFFVLRNNGLASVLEETPTRQVLAINDAGKALLAESPPADAATRRRDAIMLRRQGYSLRQIARQTGVTYQRAQQILSEESEAEDAHPNP